MCSSQKDVAGYILYKDVKIMNSLNCPQKKTTNTTMFYVNNHYEIESDKKSERRRKGKKIREERETIVPKINEFFTNQT